MKIIQATSEHLNLVVPLFDAYRIFYKKHSETKAAHLFLSERIKKKESILFLAIDENDKAMGFTQLYPSYSSVALQRIYILNDLFVSEAARGIGVGEKLLNHAKKFARKMGSRGLTLETAMDNPAQKLYERLGWKKDRDVFHYTWEIESK